MISQILDHCNTIDWKNKYFVKKDGRIEKKDGSLEYIVTSTSK